MAPGCGTVVWLRRDLRLSDNPALAAAVARGGPVVVAWVFAPGEEGEAAPGAAARVFLHGALQSLSDDLSERGARLVLRRGPTIKALIDLARESGADAVYANRIYDPPFLARDERVVSALRGNGLEMRLFEADLLFPPEAIRTTGGEPFRVFTPFWRRIASLSLTGDSLPAPGRIPPPPPRLLSWPLAELQLLPSVPWDGGIRAAWNPGEKGARDRLARFLDGPMVSYPAERDRPDREGTSRLSPYLHFGCIGARQAWRAVQARSAMDASGGTLRGMEAYRRQLAWREFARLLLIRFPGTVHSPLRPEFAAFPFREDPEALVAWQKGRTGYPLVDAGMRQLWATGWMHNRVRMVVASFLVKHLLLPWWKGAAWFLDTLVDADLANNTFGWQWAAGCGADAAPWFRIFHPVLQGVKFDPQGDYVRKWLPELSELPGRWIHRPWEAPTTVLSDAGVTPGESYPHPIVDHAAARARALAALSVVRARP
jgi:deoxyribodipyrimidine photo-lyase